jgi:hypothetical protein
MNSSTDNSPGSPPASLLKALQKLLRPMVRLLLHKQITYPQLAAMLKPIYVSVAEEEMQVPGKRQSDSRINLLTGIHRKDVKRLRAEPEDTSGTPSNISIGAQLIGHWMGEPALQNDDGSPRPLTIKSQEGSPSEFDQLVTRVVRQDIRPRVILDEWLRLGVAQVTDDHVTLNTGAFTPDTGFDEKAFFFGKNLHDHIAAGAHNLAGHKPSYFDRSVYYDGLSPASVEQLRQLAEELGMQALTEMNKAALRLQQQDQNNETANHRINFGVFNYHARLSDSGKRNEKAIEKPNDEVNDS